MIVSNEIHIIHTPKDAETAEIVGLPGIGDECSCANCGTLVGRTGRKFTALALVLSEKDTWHLCLACASPVVKPRS